MTSQYFKDFSFFSSRSSPVEWKVEKQQIDYPYGLDFMEKRVERIASGEANEMVWLVEHPPVYTAGTSAKPEHLLWPDRFPVFYTSRGGEYTYHGPGQRIAYVMLDLKHRKQDVKAFVAALEIWIIKALACCGIQGEQRTNRIGVWVQGNKSNKIKKAHKEEKIASIGIKIRRWVSFHGVAININPNLEHFSGIIPCGLSKSPITSLFDLGLNMKMSDFDVFLRQAFEDIFGETISL